MKHFDSFSRINRISSLYRKTCSTIVKNMVSIFRYKNKTSKIRVNVDLVNGPSVSSDFRLHRLVYRVYIFGTISRKGNEITYRYRYVPYFFTKQKNSFLIHIYHYN